MRHFKIDLRYGPLFTGPHVSFGSAKATWNGKQLNLRFKLDSNVLVMPTQMHAALPCAVRCRVRNFILEGGKWAYGWDENNGIEMKVTEL